MRRVKFRHPRLESGRLRVGVVIASTRPIRGEVTKVLAGGHRRSTPRRSLAALALVLAAMASAGFGATVLRGNSPLDEPASAIHRFGAASTGSRASIDP